MVPLFFTNSPNIPSFQYSIVICTVHEMTIKMKDIITYSEEESADLAAKFAKDIASGAVIALHGSLGAGKTVFARGFARGMGITGHIPSPTFTIVQEYEIKTGDCSDEHKEWMFHMDLYRIADSSAALAFGIDEYLNNSNAIKLIEWSERIADILPEDTINIYIDHIDETSRKILINRIH